MTLAERRHHAHFYLHVQVGRKITQLFRILLSVFSQSSIRPLQKRNDDTGSVNALAR